jgi:hypothetical protein
MALQTAFYFMSDKIAFSASISFSVAFSITILRMIYEPQQTTMSTFHFQHSDFGGTVKVPPAVYNLFLVYNVSSAPEDVCKLQSSDSELFSNITVIIGFHHLYLQYH